MDFKSPLLLRGASAALLVLLASTAPLAAQTTASFDAVADTYLRQGSPNQNQGSASFLQVQSSGRNRVLVRFDSTSIAQTVGTGSLVAARLELYLETNVNNWGSTGRTVDAHRLTAAWSETGATWNCADDTIPTNQQPNCTAQWAGGSFEPAASASVLHTNGLTGRISFDVTADVAALLAGASHHGWLLKKTAEGQPGQAEYAAREGTPGGAPRLAVVYEPPTSGPDVTPPAVIFVEPVETTLVDPSSTLVIVDYADSQSGIDLASVRIELDGADISSSCTPEPARVECSGPPLAAGPHVFTAAVSDLAGNEASATHALTVELSDIEPPTVELLEPAEPTVYGDPTPRILVRYDDSETGIDPDAVEVLVDEVSISADCAIDALQASCTPPALAAGPHSLRVIVHDLAGNVAELSRSFALVLDDQPPQLTIVAPTALVRSADHTIEVQLEYGDDLSGVDPSTLRLRVDSDDFSSDCLAGPSQAQCTVIGPPVGVHPLVAEIRDLAGNLATASRSFELRAPDLAPPELTILEPPERVLGDTTPEIRLHYADDDTGVDLATLSILVDGVERAGSCETGPSEATCTSQPLAPGAHRLVVTLRDAVGNQALAERELEIVLELPIAITEPEPDLLTREATVTVAGTVALAADEVSINGRQATLSGGTFALTDVALAEGTNTLSVVARNAAGGIGMATVRVIRDIQAPQPLIFSPPEGLITDSGQIMVTGELLDPTASGATPSPAVVHVNEIEAEVEQRSFLVRELLLVPGENLVSVVAVDAAGNQGRAEVTVTYRAGASARIEEVLGNGQSAEVGERLAEPLVVRLADAAGTPLAGRLVSFEVTRGDGRVEAFPDQGRNVSALTDGNGIAQVFFTLGGRSGSGSHEVTASSPGLPSRVVFCASARPGPPRRIRRIVGNNQLGAWSAEAGQPAPFPLLSQVFDGFGNPLAGVMVTYRAIAGGGDFEGATSAEALTDANGVARMGFRLGPDEGTSNNVVEAFFEGLSEPPTIFTLSGRRAGLEADTRLAGLVLDNEDQPVPGVTVHIDDTALETTTDAEGRFLLEGVPVGRVHLGIDGSTATRPGVWPHLGFLFSTISGVRNDLGMPIRMLPIDVEHGAIVGGPTDVTIPITGVPGGGLTVRAGSATFPDGSPTGLVSITQVHSDKVPMLAPLGSAFMLAWTVQPPGVHFNPPAQIAIPNLGAAPGTVVDIFSFDHDLGEFVTAGTAAVTPDGRQLISTPGSGVTKAGWGGCVAPPPPGGDACHPSVCTVCLPGQRTPVPKCGECERCNGGECEPKEIEEVTARADGRKEKAFAGVENEVAFEIEIEGDSCDFEYAWDFGDGGTSQERSPTHAYQEPGIYTVNVTVSCTECDGISPASDEIEVVVVKVDLEIQDLPEEDQAEPNEEMPGALLFLPEANTTEERALGNVAIKAETEDTVPMTLSIEPSGLSEGKLKLDIAAGGSKIKLWRDAAMTQPLALSETWDIGSQPETVYLSGSRASDTLSDIEIELLFEPPADVPRSTARKAGENEIKDKARGTVGRLDLVIFNPDDRNRPEGDKFIPRDMEDSPGARLSLNRDDDNGDEDSDFDDQAINGEEDRRDLSKLRVYFKPDGAASGTLRLTQEGAGQARVFDDSEATLTLPATLDQGKFAGKEFLDFYVEGLRKGNVALKLELEKQGEVQAEDSVTLRIGEEAKIELTFDDGPHAAGSDNRTLLVRDHLEENGIQDDIKARFFVQTHAPARGSSTVGRSVLSQLVGGGHRVEIHTGSSTDHTPHPERVACPAYSDPAVPSGSAMNALEADLVRARSLLQGLGATVGAVRPVQGKVNTSVRAAYNRVGLAIYGWDVDSEDARSCPGDLECSKRELQRQLQSAIKAQRLELTVLFHDIRATTSQGLGDLIQAMEDAAQHLGYNAKFGLLGRSSLDAGLQNVAATACDGEPR